jgi:hypothetical protein
LEEIARGAAILLLWFMVKVQAPAAFARVLKMLIDFFLYAHTSPQQNETEPRSPRASVLQLTTRNLREEYEIPRTAHACIAIQGRIASSGFSLFLWSLEKQLPAGWIGSMTTQYYCIADILAFIFQKEKYYSMLYSDPTELPLLRSLARPRPTEREDTTAARQGDGNVSLNVHGLAPPDCWWLIDGIDFSGGKGRSGWCVPCAFLVELTCRRAGTGKTKLLSPAAGRLPRQGPEIESVSNGFVRLVVSTSLFGVGLGDARYIVTNVSSLHLQDAAKMGFCSVLCYHWVGRSPVRSAGLYGANKE